MQEFAMMSRMMIRFVEEIEEREAAQHVVKSVVVKVGRFNGDKVPRFLKAYTAEMNQRDRHEVERLKCFCRVVVMPMYEEIKKLPQDVA